MSYVENFMKDFESRGQVDNMLSYEDKFREIAYIYSFDSNTLKRSMIIAKLSKANEITDFLLERYIPVDVDESNYIASMISIDKKNAVFLYLGQGLTTVTYMPFDSSSKSMHIDMETATKKYAAINKENITEAISLLQKIEEHILF